MLCLLLTALIWGFAFVAQVQGMDSMSPMFFNATPLHARCIVIGADSAVAAWSGEQQYQ
ncbi:EamA-like transporter family protein [Bifidobacterium bifidum]|nr:EamA-like transporter family protein [Bifidobacterium bifidum]